MNFIKGVRNSFIITNWLFIYRPESYQLTSSRRGYYYFNSNKNLTVRIQYSLTNDWIDVDFIYQADARNVMTNWDQLSIINDVIYLY